MIGHELAVEQPEAAHPQSRHQPGERYLGSIGGAREHAFAEEGAAKRYAIETADQPSFFPAFDTMGMTHGMKPPACLENRPVDPGFVAILRGLGAESHDVIEGPVRRHLEAAVADDLAQRVRHMKGVEWNDRPATRLNPEDVRIICRVRHRKDPDGIGTQ
jgi:hypothetical protein